MKKKVTSGIMIALLLISMLTLAFNIQPIKSGPKTWTADDDRPFIHGTTQDLPLKNPPDSLYPSAVDIIHPQPGQFASYSHSFYYPNGTSWNGWWNVSYNEYAQPHVINVTHVVVRPLPPNGTFWCTVDTTNRWVTNTNPEFWWNQTWYIFWIETGVTIGSTINWWIGTAKIVGSKTLHAVGRHIDCWIANFSYNEYDYDLSYYDKISGLGIAGQSFRDGQLTADMTLNATNIPIGEKSSTAIYFNLNPNPTSVGETVNLKGILVNVLSTPLANETIKLYARPLTGSWRYITSLTTNGYGVLMWQAVIPVTGIFVFAVYYPGSETYESTYSLAVLIVQ